MILFGWNYFANFICKTIPVFKRDSIDCTHRSAKGAAKCMTNSCHKYVIIWKHKCQQKFGGNPSRCCRENSVRTKVTDHWHCYPWSNAAGLTINQILHWGASNNRCGVRVINNFYLHAASCPLQLVALQATANICKCLIRPVWHQAIKLSDWWSCSDTSVSSS